MDLLIRWIKDENIHEEDNANGVIWIGNGFKCLYCKDQCVRKHPAASEYENHLKKRHERYVTVKKVKYEPLVELQRYASESKDFCEDCGAYMQMNPKNIKMHRNRACNKKKEHVQQIKCIY